MSLRRLPLVLAACIAATGAQAADPPAVYEEEIRPAVYDWTGLYAGLNVGVGYGVENVTIVNGEDPPIDTGGVLIGGQIGANIQFGQVVLGAEADWTWTDMSAEDWRINEFIQVETDWLATLRLRAGYDFDGLLVYATGGAAFVQTTITLPSTAESGDKTHTGWVLGGGMETLLTDNLSARAEYLYFDFPTERYTLRVNQADADLEMHMIRLGLNYRLPL